MHGTNESAVPPKFFMYMKLSHTLNARQRPKLISFHFGNSGGKFKRLSEPERTCSR